MIDEEALDKLVSRGEAEGTLTFVGDECELFKKNIRELFKVDELFRRDRMSDVRNIEYKECKVIITNAIRDMKGNIDLNVVVGVLRELSEWFAIQRDISWRRELEGALQGGVAMLQGGSGEEVVQQQTPSNDTSDLRAAVERQHLKKQTEESALVDKLLSGSGQ